MIIAGIIFWIFMGICTWAALKSEATNVDILKVKIGGIIWPYTLMTILLIKFMR